MARIAAELLADRPRLQATDTRAREMVVDRFATEAIVPLYPRGIYEQAPCRRVCGGGE